MRTALTEQFGITHPIVSAGMARVAQAPLVAAVSEAGAMGCLGGVSYFADALRDEVRAVRRATSRPFAVNLLVPPSLVQDDVESWEPVRRRWEALSPADRDALRGVEPMLTPGACARPGRGRARRAAGGGGPHVRRARLVRGRLPRARHQGHGARRLRVPRRAGRPGRSDFIVAQGTEGGGHTGYVGTLVLMPSVVDAVEAPVLAAGGIVDGRGLAAVRCLGAQGVWMGTRFIATTEAYGHPAYKQRVIDSASRDAVISRAYTGKPLRTLQNEWTREWAQRVDEIEPFPAQYAVAGVRVESGYQEGDVEQGMMPAGQAVEGIHDIRPAGDIVRAIVAEAEQILAEGGG